MKKETPKEAFASLMALCNRKNPKVKIRDTFEGQWVENIPQNTVPGIPKIDQKSVPLYEKQGTLIEKTLFDLDIKTSLRKQDFPRTLQPSSKGERSNDLYVPKTVPPTVPIPVPVQNPQWSKDSKEVIDWFLSATDLPKAPLRLCQGILITDTDSYYQSLREDIAAGPRGPRTLFGALYGDLWRLRILCMKEGEY